jgi:hypothetical protein
MNKVTKFSVIPADLLYVSPCVARQMSNLYSVSLQVFLNISGVTDTAVSVIWCKSGEALTLAWKTMSLTYATRKIRGLRGATEWCHHHCCTFLQNADSAAACYWSCLAVLLSQRQKNLMSLSMFHGQLVACTSYGSEIIPYLYWLLSFWTQCI